MNTPKLTIFILGLSASIVPVNASLTYYCSNGCSGTTSQFTTQATVTDGLTLSSLITFTGTLTDGGDEYVDLSTGVQFFAFNSSGTSARAFESVSGGDLNLAADSGDSIEVVLPASTYGVAFNFTTAFPSGDNLCLDPSQSQISSCDSGGTFINENASGFAGALNDNPTPATLTTIWISALNSGSGAAADLQSFEIATMADNSSAPDVATAVTLGAGLILISALHRRARLLRSRSRG